MPQDTVLSLILLFEDIYGLLQLLPQSLNQISAFCSTATLFTLSAVFSQINAKVDWHSDALRLGLFSLDNVHPALLSSDQMLLAETLDSQKPWKVQE